MPLKFEVEGFNDLMRKIEKAGGSIKSATRQCMQTSANIMEAEMNAQMSKANVPAHLISEMPAASIEMKDGLTTAHVGYKKGAYDPHNLSTGYKVLFLNYGTPNRKEHGQVKARGFIDKAKKRAKPKIKKAQKDTLHEILKGL